MKLTKNQKKELSGMTLDAEPCTSIYDSIRLPLSGKTVYVDNNGLWADNADYAQDIVAEFDAIGTVRLSDGTLIS